MRRPVMLCLYFFLTLFWLNAIPYVYAQGPVSCTNVTEIPQGECEALVALYQSTDGDNWNDDSPTALTCVIAGVAQAEAQFLEALLIFLDELEDPSLGIDCRHHLRSRFLLLEEIRIVGRGTNRESPGPAGDAATPTRGATRVLGTPQLSSFRSRIARNIRSDVIGRSRSRTAVASATALAIAGATPIRPGSPIALAPNGPDGS